MQTSTTKFKTKIHPFFADIASFCSSDPALVGLGVGSLYFSRVGTSNRETDQKFELIAGEETIEEKLNEMKFRISPGECLMTVT